MKIRLRRFRLRLYTITVSLTLKPNKAIELKLYEIIRIARQKYVEFDFNNAAFKVDITSTVRLLVKEFTNLDNELRNILAVLPALHDYFSPGKVDSIYQALLNIAPSGFTGIEKDYYYVIQVLFNNANIRSIFNEKQNIQWQKYRLEIVYLQNLLSINAVNDPLTLDVIIRDLSKLTINLPMSKFLASNLMSENTYTRFLTASGIYIACLWEIVLNCIITAITLRK